MSAMHYLSVQPWVERLGWTLIHFLWEGALIAACYAIVRSWLARSRNPQTRYLLACVALGAMVTAPAVTFWVSGGSGGAAFALSAPTSAGQAVGSVPFETLPTAAAASASWSDEVMPMLVTVWLAGAFAFWVRLMGGLIVAARTRSVLVRPAPQQWQQTFATLKARIQVSSPVQLLVSARVQVPTVIGWLRPAVLMPTGALTGLAPEYLEALLAHELAHIRRHDYLVNILQSLAEGLLFYHPAVWWISNHCRNEREMCCDDVAARAIGDRLIYACALADLESRRPQHFTAALAANGGSLRDRIALLLGQSQEICAPGGGLLLSSILGLVITGCLFGQLADTRPVFDVASVKQDKSETGIDRIDVSKESLIIVNVSLKRCIGMAYGVAEGRDYLFSGPDWLDSERFDISAKYAAGTPKSQVLLMLQRLLEDRFKLRSHRESKEFSVYALVAGKKGAKLQPAASPEGSYGFRVQPGHAQGSSLTMPMFADRLSRPAFQLGRQVVDFTGLTGTFDLTLDWKADDPAVESKSDASIFTAIQEQLGLRLEPRKVALDVLVVDHANRVPAEN